MVDGPPVEVPLEDHTVLLGVVQPVLAVQDDVRHRCVQHHAGNEQLVDGHAADICNEKWNKFGFAVCQKTEKIPEREVSLPMLKKIRTRLHVMLVVRPTLFAASFLLHGSKNLES